MHPPTIQSGLLTGRGSPSPSHKGGRWEVGRRVLCRGLASRHGTRGWPLGPPRGMRSASVPNRLRLLDHAAGQERRKFKFKMSSSVRLVFSFQARAPCPTGCSIRNFAFNTAERTHMGTCGRHCGNLKPSTQRNKGMKCNDGLFFCC